LLLWLQLRQDISTRPKRAGPSASGALAETAGAAVGLPDFPATLRKVADAAIRTQNKNDCVMFEKREAENLCFSFHIIKTPLRDYKGWGGYI